MAEYWLTIVYVQGRTLDRRYDTRQDRDRAIEECANDPEIRNTRKVDI